MEEIKLIDNLLDVMEITITDHDIAYNEINNVYSNLCKKDPKLFIDKHEEGNKWGLRIIKRSERQYKYRCYVRTVYAGIEALSYCIKRIAVNGYLNSEKSIKEKAKSEYKNLLDKKISFAEKIKYSFRLFSKIHTNFNYKVGNKNWTNFKNTISIRHRVTHPKSKKDFYLSRNDIKKVNNAYKLFTSELDQLIRIWR